LIDLFEAWPTLPPLVLPHIVVAQLLYALHGRREEGRILELKIDKQQKAELAKAVQDYLVNELDVDVSGLQCEMLLDHVAEVIGPAFYNQGLRDAQAVISRRMDDAAADIDVLEQPLNGR